MSRLPLFPLGTVLFPGAPLPLQVFEPRYVELLRDLGRRPPTERQFGVVTLRRGNEVGADSAPELAQIGTAARLTNIGRASGGPDGVVLVIETVGETRFRLDSFAAAEKPYFVGEVTWLEDVAASSEELARAARGALVAFEEFAESVGALAEPPTVPTHRLAYALAESIALPVEDRQAILDSGDPVSRLAMVSQFLRRERLLTGELHMVPTQRYSFEAPSPN